MRPMHRLRRNYVPGGSYFFTVVTCDRMPILTHEASRLHLREAILKEQSLRPFELSAIVVLPDHLHAIMILPDGDSDYSTRWKQIKDVFTRKHVAAGGEQGHLSDNRRQHQERAVWQHRFWEHTIDSDDDFKRCLDYVHWNPVKHRYVQRPRDYEWSSFSKWVAAGEYPANWGDDGLDVRDIPGAE